MKLLILLAILVEVFPVIALKTIVDVLQNDSRFKTLVGHVKRTGLDSCLDELSKGTLFAPTNDAFDGKKDTISRDQLLYHLIGAEWYGKDFYDGQILETMYVRDEYLGEEGQRLVVKSSGKKGDTFINDAQVVDADIKAGNGVIHAIDGLLMPPRVLGKCYRVLGREIYGGLN
jgi:transforming growth factor-beta-induced protein